VFEALARVVYEIRNVMTADGTAGFTQVLRAHWGLPTPSPGERRDIPSDDAGLLARFGRYRLLGWEPAGEPGPIDDWFERLARWHQPLIAGPPALDSTVDRLNALATAHGGWVAIGAWKLLLDYDSALATAGRDTLAACLRAYDAFGITNLSVHMPPVELSAYVELFDRPPPMDGFFWPAVFSTPHGPQKSHYIDAAAAVAAGRRPQRFAHRPGVAPTQLSKAHFYSLWDYGRILLLGPLLMDEEARHEPAIIHRVRRVADGADHELVLRAIVEHVESDPDPAWTAVGGARFCEERLDPSLTGSDGHQRLLAAGLDFLERQGLLASSVSPECLSPAEVKGLEQRSAWG
jgi:hypothetical protein